MRFTRGMKVKYYAGAGQYRYGRVTYVGLIHVKVEDYGMVYWVNKNLVVKG